MTGRLLWWVAGVAGAAVAIAGCGMAAPVYSEVAASPADYSPDDRVAEIERLDLYIDDRMTELGIERADPDAPELAGPGDGGMSVPPDLTGSGSPDRLDVRPEPAAVDEADEGSASGDRPAATKRLAKSGGGGHRDSAASSRCKRVCDAAEAICIAADRICRIADSLPDHPTAGKRCARARNDCERAKTVAATCGCRFSG